MTILSSYRIWSHTNTDPSPRKLLKFPLITDFHCVKGVDLPASIHISLHTIDETSLTQTHQLFWISFKIFCVLQEYRLRNRNPKLTQICIWKCFSYQIPCFLIVKNTPLADKMHKKSVKKKNQILIICIPYELFFALLHFPSFNHLFCHCWF